MNRLSESSTANGPIARAAEQFEEASRRRTLEQGPRQRLNRAITVIDSMIAMLERHNVKGTLPTSLLLESGLSEVIRATAYLGISVTRGRSHAKVMNELFAVQQRLMAMRAGPAWGWAYTDEEDDPVPAPILPSSAVASRRMSLVIAARSGSREKRNGLARGRGSQGR